MLLDAPGAGETSGSKGEPPRLLLPSPQERLQALVDEDEEKAANVLRAWLSETQAAPAAQSST